MGSSRMRPSACSRTGSRLGASVVFAEMRVPPGRGVPWADARRPEADALRAEIQRTVLADIQTSEIGGEATR